ncbi:MAG: hypothetical protein AAGL17_20900, partial [Cyanobacteria bacterium J06576_12]
MKNRWYRWTFIVAAVVVLVFGLRSCFSGDDLISRDPGEEIDAELTLRTVTLEQPDEDGTLLWRLKAESVTVRSVSSASISSPGSRLIK